MEKSKHITPEMIFKLPTCSRTCRLKDNLKKCLQFTKAIKTIRNKNQIIEQSTNTPILCYKGGKKLGNILVKATIPLKMKKIANSLLTNLTFKLNEMI